MIPNRIILLGSVVAAVAMLAVSTIMLAAARSELRSEETRLITLARDVQHLQQLRAAEAHAQGGKPAEDDLLGVVRQIAQRAGLPASSFQRLATTGEEAVRGREGYRRISYRVELGGLDATDLGSFLSLWQSEQPLWSVSRIELSRQTTSSRRGRQQPEPGYAVSLTLSTIYTAPDRSNDE